MIKKTSEKIFDSRKKIVCPVCKGKMLKENYTDTRFENLTYKEWQTHPIAKLFESIHDSDNHFVQKIKAYFFDAIKLNLGDLSLSEKICNLNAVIAQKIKFLSLFFNRVYGTGIILKNMDNLPIKEKIAIEEMAIQMKENNTIWVLD